MDAFFNTPALRVIIDGSAVNSLSGRTKLFTGKPPSLKSTSRSGSALLLEYGFEVIWHNIMLSNSTSAKTSAGRIFLPFRFEKGKETSTTVPTVNCSMLRPPQDYSSPLLMFVQKELEFHSGFL